MFSQVSVQIGLLAEAPVAQRTSVWPLFVVDVSDMALEIGAGGETAFAEVAFVRLFTGVGPQMAGQIG